VKTTRRKTFLEDIYRTIKGKSEYKNLQEATLQILATTASAESPTSMKQKRVQQNPKKYTKGGSGRKIFGGWSDEGHQSEKDEGMLSVGRLMCDSSMAERRNGHGCIKW
jgi:hypothetical protein